VATRITDRHRYNRLFELLLCSCRRLSLHKGPKVWSSKPAEYGSGVSQYYYM
jgi:hypothetical protein